MWERMGYQKLTEHACHCTMQYFISHSQILYFIKCHFIIVQFKIVDFLFSCIKKDEQINHCGWKIFIIYSDFLFKYCLEIISFYFFGLSDFDVVIPFHTRYIHYITLHTLHTLFSKGIQHFLFAYML